MDGNRNLHSLALNPNLSHTKKSATLAINERSQQLISEGKTVYRLGLGQSPFPVPQIMVDALCDAAHIKDYLAVQGLKPLRDTISDYLKRTESVSYAADQIIVGPGTKELMYILQNVLNTELLLPAPSWVSYEPQARLCGLECHWIPCSAKNNWNVTAESLATAISIHPNAKLLILNAPNNPSGGCFNEDELKQIAEVARKNNIVVLSDEIYSALNYQNQHKSLARYYPEGTIISNGISKWSGAGGWRLGFMAIPNELYAITEAMTVFASETYTSVSAPIQYAAIKAFEDSEELNDYIQTNQIIMQFLTSHFATALQQADIICPTPEGGFYVLCELSKHQALFERKGIDNGAQLCEQLLEDIGLACLPGKDFGLLNNEFSIRFALVDFDGRKAIDELKSKGTDSLNPSNPIYSHIFNAAEKLTNWLKQ